MQQQEGVHTICIDTKHLIIDKQLLNHINTNYSYTEVIKSIGDSMEPDISNDSLVFIDNNDTNIKDKRIYFINKENTLYKKRIKDNRYYMNSSNTIYNDTELIEYNLIGKAKGVLIKL